MQIYQLGKRFSNLAAQLAGGKAYFRIAGTTNPATIYADPDLTEEHAYPIVADAYGNFPENVYHDGTLALRLDVIASNGDLASPLASSEQINTSQAAGTINGAEITEASIPATAFEPGAVPDALGFTPQEDLTALTTPERNALARGYSGTFFYYFGTTAPTGAVRCYGETIGSAASSATLASDDYQALFNLLWTWAAADSPILTNAGAGSTRGGSASADWAAGKRLTLPDLRGEFLRGIDGGRALDAANVIGHAAVEMVGPHGHNVHHATSAGSGNDTTANGGAMTDSVTAASVSWLVETNSGTENRPRSVALMPCVWI